MIKASGGFQLRNPVPELARDTTALQKLFGKDSFFVPYARTGAESSHSTLNMLFSLFDLSPTAKAGSKVKSDICFSKLADSSLSFVSELEAIGINETSVKAIARSVYRDEMACGTFFILLRISEVQGQYSATISRIPPQNALPIWDEKGKSGIINSVAYTTDPISKSSSFSAKDVAARFTVTSKYPNFTKRGSTYETVFQVNAQGYESEFWGRPVVDANTLYLDYRNIDLFARISQTHVTTNLVVFIPEPGVSELTELGISREQYLQDASGEVRGVMTAEGKGQSVAVMTYTGENPPVMEHVEINRDSAWAEFMSNRSIRGVCSGIGVPPELIGLSEFRSSIGGNVVKDTLVMCEVTSIRPTQIRVGDAITSVCRVALEIANKRSEGKIEFVSALPEIIELLNEKDGGN